MPTTPPAPLGATVEAGGAWFRVWAPKAAAVTLVVDDAEHPLADEGHAHFATFVPGARAGARYGFRLGEPDGTFGPPFPDPHSRSQPDGVHGLSAVVDPAAFAWTDGAWCGVAHRDLVFYELHVGTFTPEGTFEAAAEKLPYLRDLGVTAVELMPCADFPGRFNWGYDPAAFFAPARAYGRPDDLRRLVDRAHALGLAVVHDVVLNHLGPDGAYVNAFAPMLVPADTPWGSAVNLDRAGHAGVRRFLREAALVWLTEYHMDGLRLDATSQLVDGSEPPFLAELSAAVAALPGRPRVLVAEDLRNRAVVTTPRAAGGYGLDAQWVDDLHFQLRVLAGDRQPYYTADYGDATLAAVATTLGRNWWRTGRSRRTPGALAGTPPEGPPEAAVFYLDDHDLTGNRPHGDRLSAFVPERLYRALSAVLLVAPQLPLLWMGQEWGATAPFPFFADHHDALAPLVRAGRAAEHAAWWAFEGEPPDPAAEATFASARLDWAEADRPPHAGTRALYRRLLALRPALPPGPADVVAHGDAGLVLRRGPYTLVAALRAGAVLPCPDGAPLLTTEDAAFSAAPEPPVVAGGTATFPVPAAVLFGPA